MDPKRREQIRQYLEKLVKEKVLGKRIHALTVNPLYHGSSKMRVVEGQACADLEPNTPAQKVLAIFESQSFLVVTEERGAGSGLPFIFTRTETVRVEDEPD
jgi:hypothetical protein